MIERGWINGCSRRTLFFLLFHAQTDIGGHRCLAISQTILATYRGTSKLVGEGLTSRAPSPLVSVVFIVRSRMLLLDVLEDVCRISTF